MISVAIMAHPKRRDFVAELVDQLDRVPVIVWDQKDEEWDTGRRSLLCFDPAASHHLVIQDDAIPCRELVAGIESAVANTREHPVGLYLGHKNPERSTITYSFDAALAAGASWLEMEGPWWGVGVVFPTAHIPAMVAWGDQHTEYENFDMRLGAFYRREHIRCWYTVPSLVDHRPESENPPLLDGHYGNRVAHRFLGVDRSALEIEWQDTAAKLSLPPKAAAPQLTKPAPVNP
jgi:hypothetical protein